MWQRCDFVMAESEFAYGSDDYETSSNEADEADEADDEDVVFAESDVEHQNGY